MTGETAPARVLVLCTGNSCRSIMAEALINHLANGRYRAFSAGSSPAGYVHPQSVGTLKRHGIDPGEPYSKSWDVFAGQHFDLLITVCDNAAQEACPVFPGDFRQLHWSTPDPAEADGADIYVEQAFDAAFEMLAQRIRNELL